MAARGACSAGYIKNDAFKEAVTPTIIVDFIREASWQRTPWMTLCPDYEAIVLLSRLCSTVVKNLRGDVAASLSNGTMSPSCGCAGT
ncbi:hypothetical protein WN55_08544 [Dufourea novaeangliae]|uniref:Uncharacterized protein n=1 Tax=Dufourea novaeangliae TaxID=178035 RepID=A0A154P5M8_DUFNO|nr:hypothetical protein WN55_08544 [Dufourea novaeangliae]